MECGWGHHRLWKMGYGIRLPNRDMFCFNLCTLPFFDHVQSEWLSFADESSKAPHIELFLIGCSGRQS